MEMKGNAMDKCTNKWHYGYRSKDEAWPRSCPECPECHDIYTENIPSHLESPDYKTPLKRALLINDIFAWYHKKFANRKSDYIKVSVYDLIADFIIDNKYSKDK